MAFYKLKHQTITTAWKVEDILKLHAEGDELYIPQEILIGLEEEELIIEDGKLYYYGGRGILSTAETTGYLIYYNSEYFDVWDEYSFEATYDLILADE